MLSYSGNGAYCYANSTAMLLTAANASITPAQIEVVTGVGLGGLWLPDMSLLLFGFQSPDIGVSAALDMMGFNYQERSYAEDAPLPVEDLRTMLAVGPVVIGPLDMGELLYMPDHQRLRGVDHYALVYGIGDNSIELHDPAEFPCVQLPFAALERAWRAERIGYRRGAFRCWTAPQQQRIVSPDALFVAAMQSFREQYASMAHAQQAGAITGATAIRHVASLIAADATPNGLYDQFSHFSFPLGAKRALDYAVFFAERAPHVAKAKWQQARAFGAAQSAVMAGNDGELIKQLHCIADQEETIAAQFA